MGITVLTREKKWTLVKKDVGTQNNVTNVVRALSRQVAIATKKNNKVTRILGSLGFLVFKSLGLAESGGSRFPWTSVNNCTQDAIPSESCGVSDIGTSNLRLKQIYAGSYFEELVGVLDKNDDLAKQRCIECGSDSEFYGKSDSYLCVLHRPKHIDVCEDWKKWASWDWG